MCTRHDARAALPNGSRAARRRPRGATNGNKGVTIGQRRSCVSAEPSYGRRVRHRVQVLAAALVTLAVAGCGPSLACTQRGGFNGVGVAISKALFVRSGTVEFEVCDAKGCASAEAPLGRLREPGERGQGVSFSQLGRDFAPGEVTVSVELRGPDGELVATRQTQVELKRYWPNGKACDGDGYVSGSVRLRPQDKVG